VLAAKSVVLDCITTKVSLDSFNIKYMFLQDKDKILQIKVLATH
jgi:hypothetical protein